MDHISIIIVHYNTDKETRELVNSLKKVKTSDFKFSAIIVDNASKQPLKLPSTLLGDNFEVVRSESNLGFTGGNNLGIKYAIDKYHSEYLLLLNSDTLVEPNFLIELRKCMRDEPAIGLITPKIYFAKNYEFHRDSYAAAEKGKVFWYAGGSIDWANLDAFHRGVDELDRGQFDHQTRSDFATGCCVLIRREVLETIGLFNDDLFLYLEDVDLSVRARLRGFEIGFCPNSVIWHKNAGSSGGSGSQLHLYYQTRNRLWFAWRYGSFRIKVTTVRFALRLLQERDPIIRRAVSDAVIGNMGKQSLI